MSSLVTLILGAGPNVGSRNPDVDKPEKEGFYPVKVDITLPDSVSTAYKTVCTQLGTPNTVVFNVTATFIVTGNARPFLPHDNLALFNPQSQKMVEARLTEVAWNAYVKEGIRFHFALLFAARDPLDFQRLQDGWASACLRRIASLSVVRNPKPGTTGCVQVTHTGALADGSNRFTLDGKQWSKS
ncbi:hypothetical protein EDD18DRAFT_1347020 [Armillaria luteobubalina]|uniref:Uncharacterized protein n=1 Tax=Armillaria luteobubalina TaxID=153913 RepID=A0AA39QGE2_9AGAR|nr:hypothetical protein EDD18DRAFT_1347020 [Armillaria luteobubalina]